MSNNYYKDFIKAVERTRSWGLDSGEIALDKTRLYLDRNSDDDLLKMLEWNYHGLDEQKLCDCTNVSLNMLSMVQDHFCADAYLTTGNLLSDNTPLFECTLEYLKTQLEDNMTFKPKLKVHVWITLESGEIIDFTFFRSMARTFLHYTPFKDQIVISPLIDDLGLTYVPMIVGSDYYKKAGSMFQICLD